MRAELIRAKLCVVQLHSSSNDLGFDARLETKLSKGDLHLDLDRDRHH